MEILDDLTPLIISAFHRIPSPAYGPRAFKNFFDTIYHRLGVSGEAYPVGLYPCVAVSYHFFGGMIPEGMEYQTQPTSIHSKSLSLPPPAQKPRPATQVSNGILYDWVVSTRNRQVACSTPGGKA